MLIPTKPQDVTWTDAQWRAIYAEGRDVLVSAAAGSGKTAVLIERLIQKIIRDVNPIDVDELLVVTFTNASAAEMRHRMAEALEKALMKDPASSHLRRQLSLLNKAQISTLHSFCLSIVKQYAYVLDIDPGFRLANEAEAALIRDDVLAEVLETAYKADDPEPMYRLADSFTTDRDDQLIETLIDRLYDTASVHPDPKKWLLAIPESYDVPERFIIDDLPFMGALKLTIQHSLEEAYAMTEEIRQLALHPAGPAPFGTTVEQDQQLIAEAIRRISTESWQSTFDYFQNLKFVNAARIPKDTFDEDLVKNAKDKRNLLKKRVNEVKDSYFTRTPSRLLEEMRLMHPILKTLVELTLTFGERYRHAKNERGLVDFSDLEHFALQVLTNEENGELTPSNIAKDITAQFKEVLVDEYQDTNRLQETILQIVKTGTEANGNMFMVGDVKQSIYRFRLAEPMLFLNKYATFTTEAGDSGVKIDLNANFRSRPEVLHATNFIFSQIMGERVGEIDYDEAAALKPGAPYPDVDEPVELIILTQEEEDGEESSEDESVNEETLELEELKKSQWEARYIIRKIKALMDSKTMVFNPWTKSERLLEYRDIVILMRSMTWSADLTEEFKEAGIPLYANLSKGYFEALEVMIMLNTLRIIDNPYQDIPMASVLRAPFVGLTESELSHIRLASPKEPFFEALKIFVRTGGSGIAPPTAEKLVRFFRQFEEWRNLARRGSLADLIWRIYMDTHYYEMVGAMPNGKQRQANLRTLHDRAMSYEKSSFRGLFRFMRFIDRMKKRGDDLGTARAMSEKENVVRLMTIHSSKGLEFPYVFIAGLGRDFNQMDFNQLYLFDQTFGLAVKAVDPDKRISYTSLPFLAVKEKKQLELKAEEMRVLYVAMTRAKEKLMLVATVKDAQKSMNKWQDIASNAGGMLPEYIRSRAKGFLDWIGPAIARHNDYVQWQGTSNNGIVQDPSKWSIEKLHVDQLRQELAAPNAQTTENESTETKEVSKEIHAEVERRFNAVYPYERAIGKRTKQSVSELKRLDQLRKEEEPEFFRPSQVQKAMTSVYKRPAFLQQDEQRLTSAEIGTAMHTAMQHIDINLEPSRASIERFIHELETKQLVTSNEASAIKVDEILTFLQSPLAERLRQAKQFLREVPFTYGLKDEDGDIQILQGIADGLFQEADGHWVLLDYKTDRIKGVFVTESSVLREMHIRYGMQLSLYQEAIENILSIRIKEKLLYLFDANQTILLEDSP